jgi:laminin gamma 1
MPIYGGMNQQQKHQTLSTIQNGLPSYQPQTFRFQLNQHAGWMPSLTINDFQRLLSNLSAIKIRVSYSPSTNTVVSKLNLKSAKLFSQKTDSDEIYISENGLIRRKNLQPALYVEECKCPVGHRGEHCEQCAEGYRREPANGGPFARCVPCTCNNHSYSCDANTGKCNCVHHTSGDNCEKCEHGYYGSSITMTPKNEAENGVGSANWV